MEPLYLALDQGGHASRAIALNPNGHTLAHSVRPITTFYGPGGHIEHDPFEVVESLLSAACNVFRELGREAERLAGAGLATQRSNIVCWDRETGEPLSPIISWQDTRGASWLDGLCADAQSIHERTGLRLNAHYGASKLRWCLDHLDSVQKAMRDGRLAWGPMASYLIHRLLEERPLFADPANAARTLLWNPSSGDWDEGLMRLFGIPGGALPRCVPSRYDYGHLAIGGHRIPLTVLTGDQSAALFAFGAPAGDTVYINTGTGIFLQRCLTSKPCRTSLLHSVVWHDGTEALYVHEGTVNGGASALRYEAQRLGVTDFESCLPEWLGQYRNPPLFLNGIGGLGSPYWIADFPSRYIGEGDAGACMVAVLESIVFLIQRNLEEFSSGCTLVRQLVVSGGLANINGLCEKVATLSRLPVYRAFDTEATVRGLAYLAADYPKDFPQPKWDHVFSPGADESLLKRYQHWCKAVDRIMHNN